MIPCKTPLQICFLLLSFLPVFVWAQDASTRSAKEPPQPQRFVKQASGSFGGNTINYTATAEEIYLKNSKGEAVASIWSVSYTVQEANANRPVCFVFNGGPGSASLWLHMGLFGPRIVQVDSDAKSDDGSAPYRLITNPQGFLDLTDLVFIDPVGTGYSRVIGAGKEEDYWGLMEDAASIAQFIRLWITKHKRWNSPKYIAGESFGTTRAAAVVKELEGGGQNMAINGLILISQALDYAGSTPVHHNITSYLTFLPTMAATAWYHKKAGQGMELEDFVDQCRHFTYDHYAPALYKGNLLTESEQAEIAEKLAYFTGLDKTYILKSDLRILRSRFQMKLLEEAGLAVGGLDSRFTGEEWDEVAERPGLGDPAMYQISAAYTAAINHYLATELAVQMDRPYLASNRQIGGKWRWRPVPDEQYWEPSYVNTAPMLAETMRRNNDMRVLVACGYYDMVTPFFDAEYTFSRHGMVQERIVLTYYEGGHMMYVHDADFVKISQDIRAFLRP